MHTNELSTATGKMFWENTACLGKIIRVSVKRKAQPRQTVYDASRMSAFARRAWWKAVHPQSQGALVQVGVVMKAFSSVPPPPLSLSSSVLSPFFFFFAYIFYNKYLRKEKSFKRTIIKNGSQAEDEEGDENQHVTAGAYTW